MREAKIEYFNCATTETQKKNELYVRFSKMYHDDQCVCV